MPLADKIIELRKKQGWSQIDLADRLDVSRQSVSKWEMAQAVPELDKIIRMSELFSVTTDYLLKDDAPVPEPSPEPEQAPPADQPPAAQQPPEAPAPAEPEKPRRKKWPWVLAAGLALAASVVLLLSAAGVIGPQDAPAVTPFPFDPSPIPTLSETLVMASPSPAPASVSNTAVLAEEPSVPVSDPAEEAVIEEPVGSSSEQTAVSDPDAPETGMTEYAYEGDAMTVGGIDPAELAAIAAEYAPYGLTCEYDESRCQWYLDGAPIRVFTDVLASNGESMTGGHFQGVIRNFAGEGDIDVRAVRDYEHCDTLGNGKLLYLESCDIRHESAVWTEHHAEDHHSEEHHD